MNHPVVLFNSLDPRFKDGDVIRKSASLLDEIVTRGNVMYDAGAHSELAWQYFEAHPDELPKVVIIPDAFTFEVLVNANDSYDLFIIDTKHNKITQAQNDEKLIDYINQVKTI